jgi:hypothetical protein
MSNALAIAGTSAVLQSVLSGFYNKAGIFNSAGIGNVTVTAVAPDIAQSQQDSAQTLQVNLFLHQVTPNAAWRNVDLPSLGADGKTRLRNQPLALDLHYLLTAYGTQNFEAEALLGFAVQMLHETPALSRGDIQGALGAPLSTGNTNLNDALDLSGLADQIEMLKVTPATLGREEMAWLWTALKADYRPTFPFQVTVILIQAQNPASAPLPVLTRLVTAQAGLLSTIVTVSPPAGQSAACLGDPVTVTGTGLASSPAVYLNNTMLGIQYGPIAPSQFTNTSLQFSVPNDPAGLPSGVYLMSVQLQPAGLTTPVSTNSLPLAVAPKITSALPASVTGSSFTLNPTCIPALLARQQVSLIVGSQESLAPPLVPPQTTTSTPSFAFTNIAAGTYLVRLRVDGIDSPVAYTPAPGTPTLKVT